MGAWVVSLVLKKGGDAISKIKFIAIHASEKPQNESFSISTMQSQKRLQTDSI